MPCRCRDAWCRYFWYDAFSLVYAAAAGAPCCYDYFSPCLLCSMLFFDAADIWCFSATLPAWCCHISRDDMLMPPPCRYAWCLMLFRYFFLSFLSSFISLLSFVIFVIIVIIAIFAVIIITDFHYWLILLLLDFHCFHIRLDRLIFSLTLF